MHVSVKVFESGIFSISFYRDATSGWRDHLLRNVFFSDFVLANKSTEM